MTISSYIGFIETIGGIYIARLATGFYCFTAWTIVLPSGFYWHLHFFSPIKTAISILSVYYISK